MKNKVAVKKKQMKPKIHIKKRAIIFLVLFIAIIIGAVFGIRYLSITLKYKEYTDKMYTYGLADLYDNKKATAIEQVTNDEMLKIIIAGVTGKTDINSLYSSNYVSEEKLWLDYAVKHKFTDITENELKENANKIETILILIKALESFNGIDIEKTELKMSKSKLAKFTKDEQELIAKAVTIGIVPNKSSALDETLIIKGELNKLVVTIMEKYATVYYKTVAINEQGLLERQNVNIVTDKEKMPENYKEYPYIIDTIDNEIYEQEFEMLTKKTYQTPAVAYKYLGDLYGQIDELLVEYFEQILNVDYKTINTKDFVDSIQNTVGYRLEEKDVKEYVDYVKKNKIQLSGKIEPLLPIIYNNGEQYKVRSKITFKVLNSNTEYNLLFGDEKQKVKYNGQDITIYVDVPMLMTFNSWSLRVHVTCLAKHISNNSTSVVVE